MCLLWCKKYMNGMVSVLEFHMCFVNVPKSVFCLMVCSAVRLWYKYKVPKYMLKPIHEIVLYAVFKKLQLARSHHYYSKLEDPKMLRQILH